MNAIEPIVLTNKSDLYLVSTPRGQRGFFYEIGISPRMILRNYSMTTLAR